MKYEVERNEAMWLCEKAQAETKEMESNVNFLHLKQFQLEETRVEEQKEIIQSQEIIDKFQIFVKGYAGKTVSVDINKNMTILDVKKLYKEA